MREVDADARVRDSSEEACRSGATGLTEELRQDRQLLAARDQLARAQTGSGSAAVATFQVLGDGRNTLFVNRGCLYQSPRRRFPFMRIGLHRLSEIHRACKSSESSSPSNKT